MKAAAAFNEIHGVYKAMSRILKPHLNSSSEQRMLATVFTAASVICRLRGIPQQNLHEVVTSVYTSPVPDVALS